MELEIASKSFEALGSPTRLSIYRILVQAGGSGLSVGDIQQRLDVPASTLSHHIAKLVHAGLVNQQRESRTLFCSVDYAAMEHLIGFLLEKCCAGEGACEE